MVFVPCFLYINMFTKRINSGRRSTKRKTKKHMAKTFLQSCFSLVYSSRDFCCVIGGLNTNNKSAVIAEADKANIPCANQI